MPAISSSMAGVEQAAKRVRTIAKMVRDINLVFFSGAAALTMSCTRAAINIGASATADSLN